MREQYLEDQLWVAYDIVRQNIRTDRGKSKKDKNLEMFKMRETEEERERIHAFRVKLNYITYT